MPSGLVDPAVLKAERLLSLSGWQALPDAPIVPSDTCLDILTKTHTPVGLEQSAESCPLKAVWTTAATYLYHRAGGVTGLVDSAHFLTAAEGSSRSLQPACATEAPGASPLASLILA